ncbi:hypothetical protein PV325_007011 [Microctonus aethiopoides]|nr:hypothetical protein PV325_007011 [Microctonus aethiopoides]
MGGSSRYTASEIGVLFRDQKTNGQNNINDWPYFGEQVPRNVTTAIGQTAFLHCRVHQRNDKESLEVADISNFFPFKEQNFDSDVCELTLFRTGVVLPTGPKSRVQRRNERGIMELKIDDGRFLVGKENEGRSHRVSRVTCQRRPEVVVSAEVAGREYACSLVLKRIKVVIKERQRQYQFERILS